MEYYLVLCKCGHVSKKYYMPINFCVIAEDGEDAAAKARMIGRVKHDHDDAILNVKRVSKEEFDIQNQINANDPYLKCNSKQEQNAIYDLIKHRLVEDDHQAKFSATKPKNRRPNLRMQSKKYIDLYDDEDDDYNEIC